MFFVSPFSGKHHTTFIKRPFFRSAGVFCVVNFREQPRAEHIALKAEDERAPSVEQSVENEDEYLAKKRGINVSTRAFQRVFPLVIDYFLFSQFQSPSHL